MKPMAMPWHTRYPMIWMSPRCRMWCRQVCALSAALPARRRKGTSASLRQCWLTGRSQSSHAWQFADLRSKFDHGRHRNQADTGAQPQPICCCHACHTNAVTPCKRRHAAAAACHPGHLTTNLSRPVWWQRQSIVSIQGRHFADTTLPTVDRISEMMKRMGVMGKPPQAQPHIYKTPNGGIAIDMEPAWVSTSGTWQVNTR